MKTLSIWLRVVLGVCTASVVLADQGESAWTSERVGKIAERGKTDPDVLWELKDAPMTLVYDTLTSFWMTHWSNVISRLDMKKKGREAEYLAEEVKFGHDPEYSARVYPIARDVLLAHPDYEAYLTGKLQHLTENMLRSSTDEEYHRKNLIPGADVDYRRYLAVAYWTPGDMAFRMIGPGVFGLDHPVLDYGDYEVSSPATHARRHLADLAKERLSEEIPDDLEGARQWWRNNEHRFAPKPPPPPRTPVPTLAVSPTNTTAAATAPTPVAKAFQPSRLLICLIAGVAALLAFAILRARWKS